MPSAPKSVASCPWAGAVAVSMAADEKFSPVELMAWLLEAWNLPGGCEGKALAAFRTARREETEAGGLSASRRNPPAKADEGSSLSSTVKGCVKSSESPKVCLELRLLPVDGTGKSQST